MVNNGFGHEKTQKTRKTYRILRQIWVICKILPMHHFILSNLAVKSTNPDILFFVVAGYCSHFATIENMQWFIEWNGQRQPLKTMVLRWFWVSRTLVTMVFRWLATIGATMEWLHTIVEVYLMVPLKHGQLDFSEASDYLTSINKLIFPVSVAEALSYSHSSGSKPTESLTIC